MSIMTSTSSVYTFPIHNRLQTKNTHKLHSSPSSWLCYGEVFKESRGLFTLCGDFQMGIINIRLHISQYHIGTPQLALKLFTSRLISLTTCLQLQHLQIPMLSDSVTDLLEMTKPQSTMSVIARISFLFSWFSFESL